MKGKINTKNNVISRFTGTLTKSQAEAHYKAVVRALVAEAIELSTFLEKVAQGTISLPSSSANFNMDELNFTDWAKLWIQVMSELRTGIVNIVTSSTIYLICFNALYNNYYYN